MAANNYQWSLERSIPRRVVGAHNVDAVTTLSAHIGVRVRGVVIPELQQLKLFFGPVICKFGFPADLP